MSHTPRNTLFSLFSCIAVEMSKINGSPGLLRSGPVTRSQSEAKRESVSEHKRNLVKKDEVVEHGESLHSTAKKRRRTSHDDPEKQYTADGHHIVIYGRRWRATDPLIPLPRAAELRSELSRARSRIHHDRADAEAVKKHRRRVQELKVALGERGVPWWEQTEDQRKARWEAVEIRNK